MSLKLVDVNILHDIHIHNSKRTMVMSAIVSNSLVFTYSE